MENLWTQAHGCNWMTSIQAMHATTVSLPSDHGKQRGRLEKPCAEPFYRQQAL